MSLSFRFSCFSLLSRQSSLLEESKIKGTQENMGKGHMKRAEKRRGAIGTEQRIRTERGQKMSEV